MTLGCQTDELFVLSPLMSEESLTYYIQPSLPNSTSWSGPLHLARHTCQAQPELGDVQAYNTRRSWARSKRISLGCLEWRTSNPGPNRSSRSKSGGRRKSIGCEAAQLPEAEVSEPCTDSIGAQLYRTCRSKASSGADALLRRLRVRSLGKERRSRSKPGEDSTSTCTVQRSCSTPRPCTLSKECGEWRAQHDECKCRSCGSQLNSTGQSVLSLKSAPEIAGSSTTVDRHHSASHDGRRSTGLVELRSRSFIPSAPDYNTSMVAQINPLPTTYDTCPCASQLDALPGRPRSSCSTQLYRPLSQPNCVCADRTVYPQYQPRTAFSSHWSSTLPKHPAHSVNPSHMPIPLLGCPYPDQQTSSTFSHGSTEHPYPYKTAPENVPSIQTPPMVYHHRQDLSSRHSGVIYAAPNPTLQYPTPYPANVPIVQYSQHPSVGQPEDSNYASLHATKLAYLPETIHQSIEPFPPPLSIPQSKSTYSLASSTAHNQSNTYFEVSHLQRSNNQPIDLSMRKPAQENHLNSTPEYGYQMHQYARSVQQTESFPNCNQQEDTRVSTKSREQAHTRPDSLLSGSSLTAESSVSDSLHNSSSSRDSALGGNGLLNTRPEIQAEETLTSAPLEPHSRNGMRLVTEKPQHESTHIELPSSMSVIRSLRTRSQMVPPPLPQTSIPYDLKLPPTPRRTTPNWVIHDMDGTKPPLRISQQVRAERRHDVYVNAAKCPVPEPNGSQSNCRSSVGRLSPPAAWTQLLPYRVSTVPPNLSDRLKKSETLPNDVWTYSQTSSNDHQDRYRDNQSSIGVTNSTKDHRLENVRSSGPRSPPPRPPTRTTSQLPVSVDIKNPPRSNGYVSSTNPCGVQQKTSKFSLMNRYGMRETIDSSPVLCRYAQLYSMPFHPKVQTSSTDQRVHSGSPASSPLRDNLRQSQASCLDHIKLAK